MYGRVAIITGSDRGIGFEVSRQLGKRGYQIILGSPNEKKGQAAASKLIKSGVRAIFQKLDIVNEIDISTLKKFILDRFGRLDVLVNNAGVMIDAGRSKIEGLITRRIKNKPKKADFGEGQSILEVPMDVVKATLDVNTFGTLRMCQVFVPLMIETGYGRVVNVSSSLGQLNGMTDVEKVPAYQISKAALNAVTLMVADNVRGKNIAVNSVCPGWTKTDIGGKDAPQSPKEAANTIVWLATHPSNGPSGGFFKDKKQIGW
ncbi:MAG TPA: SDR family NAD(P)-dependent oxidoreductase [Candidatus Omnitrophota bacterium]|nr:SDR family NAD(P)-dependent oxidoreductase [Candidatus Omnitrophota bacterium]